MTTNVNKYGESLISNGNLFFPKSVSEYATQVDRLYNIFFVISCFFIVAILAAAIGFAIIYSRRKNRQIATSAVTHNIKLELVWFTIPLILVLIFFFIGTRLFISSRVVPPNAITCYAYASEWKWSFEYAESGITIDDGQYNQLVVPVDRPIKMLITSRGKVLHNFFVPNLRIKRDAVPNRWNSLWFQANKEGTYQVFCAEYCGDNHSDMYATIKVVSQKEYSDFIEKKKKESLDNLPPVELGKKLYAGQCSACHSLDGSKMNGPTWKGLYLSSREMVDGSKLTADEDYLRESITKPDAKIVKGYQNVMPSFGYLSDAQINGLIEYIKSLKEE